MYIFYLNITYSSLYNQFFSCVKQHSLSLLPEEDMMLFVSMMMNASDLHPSTTLCLPCQPRNFRDMDEGEQFEAEELLAAMEDEDKDNEAIKIISTQNFDCEQPCESYSDIIEQLKTNNQTTLN